ncbi:thioredoxin family protein [uncultured Treponema sp.]|uniref:thioredoxin family protein n=1 Tax=uncultured Treponema sp. TaxID=162155 RepID=UPI0025E4C9C4|nr:thioredoxin family protein [uncultured Treponema sp.]
MKKLLKVFASILFTASLISCGNKIDTSAWLTNFDDAKKAASSEAKRIFLFFSDDEGDKKSSKLKENLFNTPDFIKTYTEKYILVNLDYSNSRYDSDQENIQKDLKIFELYDAKEMPGFMILSSEGYVMSRLAFDENADLDTARITFGEAEPDVAEFEELLAKTKNGTTEQRLEAINQIFEKTDPALTSRLAPLSKLYISLDKKNESGKASNHLISLAYTSASEFFMDGQIDKACAEFEKLAKNKILTAEEKQMAYYTAGYLLASSGSTEFEKVKDFFQKAYDAAPESEAAGQLKIFLKQIQMMIDGEGDEATAVEEQNETAPAEQSENETVNQE